MTRRMPFRPRCRRPEFAFAFPPAAVLAPARCGNLPYHAAAAVAFGLSADEALKAMTLYPAQILGVADRVGSLEKGKDATLFVSDGEALDTPTQILQAWISGRKVDLNDRHKTLYEKYKQKYGE